MNRKLIFVGCMMLGMLISPLNAVEIGETLEESGTRIDLPSGDKLQLSVEDRQIIAHFVDAEGLLIEPLAESIVVVVDDPGHKNDEWRSLMVPGEENALVSSKRLYPPYNFRARIIVRFKDQTTKTYPYASLDLATESE